MRGELAGALRERVGLLRRAEGRDAIGEADGAWAEVARVWAGFRVEGRGPIETGDAASALPVWRVTLRPLDVRVGDRLARGATLIAVREVRADPALPDRLNIIGEETR